MMQHGGIVSSTRSFGQTQGGDFSATVSASQSVGAIGQYTWSSAQMVADVQSWLDNPASNFGWLVLGDESDHCNGETVRHPRERQPASADHSIHTRPKGHPYASATSHSGAASALIRATAKSSQCDFQGSGMFTKIFLALMLAAAIAAVGVRFGSARHSPETTTTATTTAKTIAGSFSHPLLFPPVNTNANVSVGIDEGCVQILDGPCTNMWTYGGTYPGLTIRRPTGQRTYVTFTNNLGPGAGEMTIHNHGNHSSAANDGQPDTLLIPTGGSRTYTYEGIEEGNDQRGKMQFYHDHRMDVTGRNVWMGLTGLYIVDDPADPSTLPSGEFDLPLAIADRQFDVKNQIPYMFNPNGVTGDKFLVNGVYQPYLEVGDRKYRFRILNASNFRTYFLELSSGDSFIQIGTESGLLPVPVTRTGMRMGPAERLDVVVNFAGELGTKHLSGGCADRHAIA